MFTGIIETIGKVIELTQEDGNLHIVVESSISKELKIDQSVSHNGVCLTVVEQNDNWHKVTAIVETLSISNLNQLNLGSLVNLERCLKVGGRLDGHMVQGHVDEVATCIEVMEDNGSWRYKFEGSEQVKKLIVNKGSICINGVSLTIVNTKGSIFEVAIIPYTYENTTFKEIRIGDLVNLEYDIIGKYIMKNSIN